ncbi:putative D-aminoacyl-tRNA deacylase [Monocercomonoides exilis]|uniref:putative D-aminoacyl-tRNA deacylase n=1 Tax=Monocercomonoides exilis TaxID=2049356 RepID=UPI00355A95BB|nr:putative D-aminoacyl-tRNA deacylase [Monocercomonoides exilis]|eukprot:MONOS_5708.1-p1 / transcript=MONOS_5708.1 / gene=MONOS_5708 / organism=Monocercomonoides_exilis_PA203 / gene_product=D-tyrosyl-tRNA deacylase / transcript_product=D-tyrosyl-tRNA deacylase / location=Mono_scaffold00169:96769-97640(-) / protein_length=206 / sequence_SO=supercontig / SO=protein_coding / is_pseudo=false
MRLIVQKVSHASVQVADKIVGSIGKGVMVLVGIADDDDEKDAEYVCKKLLKLRIFEDEGAFWKKSVVEIDGEILLVSQFTLFANLSKPKPDFHHAMVAEKSRPFFNAFVDKVRASYKSDKVQTGEFGAFMEVSLTNIGPITIIIDSKEKSGSSKAQPSPLPSPVASVCGSQLLNNKKASDVSSNKKDETEKPSSSSTPSDDAKKMD